MPQISPLSWLVLPFIFFLLFFLFLFCIWWGFFSSFFFTSKDFSSVGVGLVFNFWDW